MGIAFLGTFALSFFSTVVATVIVKKIAIKFSFLDMPSGRKQHSQPIPLGGGVAVMIGVALPVLLGVLVAWFYRDFGLFTFLPQTITGQFGGIFYKLPVLLLIFFGGVVILVLGLVDDKKGLSPYFKLLIEIIVSLALVLGGVRVSFFVGDSTLGNLVSVILTMFWIIGITNAFNLLDHMDGVSGGIAFVVSLSLFVIAFQTGELFIASLVSAISGACLAFLCFNFPPAKIFLGDAGSLFIGYMLGALTVVFTFYKGGYPHYSIFVPIIIMAVPIFDVVTVVIVRFIQGRNIFKGDRNHLAHRLLNLGMSAKETVLTIYALTLCTGLAAILLYQVRQSGAIIILIQLVIIFIVITLLEISGRKEKANE